MEKTEKDNFMNVYIRNQLNEIKSMIGYSVELRSEREEKTDKKMIKLLNSLLNDNSKSSIIYPFLLTADKSDSREVMHLLSVYYVALYYDNMDLLPDLLDENIPFAEMEFYLDKSISSQFERNKYLEMIKTCGSIFCNFLSSIQKLPKEKREIYIQRFAKLINLKYELICQILNKESSSDLSNLFRKENLDTFTDTTYIQANAEQLIFIDRNYIDSKRYSQNTCERLNNLMQTKGFSKELYNIDLMMKLYTDEELETLDTDISHVIAKFSKTEESLRKIIDFVQRRPDLSSNLILLSFAGFMHLDNFTLIELCERVGTLTDKRAEDLYSISSSKSLKVKILIKKALGAYDKNDVNSYMENI